MSQARRFLPGLALAAALAPAAAAQLQQLGGYIQPKQTTLTEIRKNADAYHNIWVTFKIQFGGLTQIDNPFFTRFVSTDFLSFSAWGEEQEIWRLEEFRHDYPFLFVDKRSTGAVMIYGLRKLQRAQVKAFVRNTFQGTAWLDVTQVEILPERVEEATLFHLVRGETLMREGKWRLAAPELAKAALQPELPPRVEGAVWTGLATCYTRIGDFPKANQALAKAKELVPGSLEVKALARLLAEKPLEGLERKADLSDLKEWEKPLWRDPPAPAPDAAHPVAGQAGPEAKVTAPPGVMIPANQNPGTPATPPPGR